MTKPKLEAVAAYENAHMVATDLVQRIVELLGDLPAPDGEVRIDWTHVGDLAEINHRLAGVVTFLEGPRN